MKKKTNVKTVIRQIVREEVAKAIHEVIAELKQPTQQVSKSKPKQKQHYSKNSVLNEVLNETANDDSGWETMGGTQYTSDKINELVGKPYMDMVDNNSNGNLAAEMGVNPTTAPDFLKKDYRAVMKALDKK